jgi:hypothetical protein
MVALARCGFPARHSGPSRWRTGGPLNQPSACSPNYFLPSIYYAKPATGFDFPNGNWIAMAEAASCSGGPAWLQREALAASLPPGRPGRYQ